MNNLQKKDQMTLKLRRKHFSIEIRKKRNREHFRRSRRAYVENKEKQMENHLIEKQIIGNPRTFRVPPNSEDNLV